MAVRRFLLRALLPSPAVGAAIAAFIAMLARPNNPDTLWHLAIGKWIFAHGAIPDISRFYYSATAGFGYDYSWLSQAILFGAYRLLGGAGIAILNSVVAGFIFYLLYKLLERNSANLLVNFVMLGLALMTISTYLSGRPAMFTAAFFALEIFILSDFVQLRGNQTQRHEVTKNEQGSGGRLIWLIPPVTALWANLHPGFAIAPFVILLFLPLGRDARARRTLAACLAATVAAFIINPYGWRMYLMPWEMARALPMLRGLTEWTGVAGWEAVVWGGFVALVACGLSLRRQPLPVILLAALAALAAGVSDRNLPLFGVVAVFTLGRTLLPVLSPVFGRASLVRMFDVKFETAGGWFWAIAVPLVLVGAVGLRVSPMNLGFNFAGYPVAAVRYIWNRGCPDNLFVRETWSGYLLWTMSGQKLFYDAKGGFSREAIKEQKELVMPKAGWRGAADRYGLSTFLLERGSPLAVVLSEAADWRRVYSDSLAEVFERAPDGQEHATSSASRHFRTPETRHEELLHGLPWITRKWRYCIGRQPLKGAPAMTSDRRSFRPDRRSAPGPDIGQSGQLQADRRAERMAGQ
jgi:hypothetical protein